VKVRFDGFCKNEKFQGIPQCEEFKNVLSLRMFSLQIEYNNKCMQDDLRKAIATVREKLDAALSTFKKGPPKEWWDESLGKMTEARELFKAFENNTAYLWLLLIC
jgi:hypothetical protein